MKFLIKSGKRVFTGFRKAYSIPTLPDHILKFTMHPTIRIIRFLGGLSVVMILSKSHLNYPFYFLYFFMFFALIFWVYHLYILYYRTKHFIAILKSDKLEVRNSPLDRLAFLSARALYCIKFGCEAAQPTGVALTFMLGADELLKAADAEPFFMPIMGGMLKNILPDSASRETAKLIQKSIDAHTLNNAEIGANKTLMDQFKSLNLIGELTNEDCSELQKLILENQAELINKNSQLKSKILELLDKKVK